MKLPKRLGWFVWVMRGLLAAIFIYAGLIKIIHPDQFLEDIEGYALLPYSLAVLAVYYLPYLEVLLGLALLFNESCKSAAILVASLMILFIIALLQAWWRGLDIQCGCFGSTATSSFYWLIIRDLVFLSMGLAIVFAIKNKQPINMPNNSINNYDLS